MTPKAGLDPPEAEEEAPPGLARDPSAGDLKPPTGLPTSQQDTKPVSPPGAASATLHLAPETLDPRTLQLLWGQRELEIQALRWAVKNGCNTQHQRVLQEVAGFPPQRSPHSQEKLLQNQVHKLRLELQEQKEKSQQDKEMLEQRLLQATRTLQQLEAELQVYQKSCLLQLARASWVGRTLRSQTGSVEVVTAETLREPSDMEDSDPALGSREGFRLEDTDWNSIARRYPNLFTDFEPNPEPREPPSQGSQPDQRRHKSVEWSSLPQPSSSSSRGAGSDSSSCQLAPEEAQAPRGVATRSLGREEPSEGGVGSPRGPSSPGPAGCSQPVQRRFGARHPHRQTPRGAPLEGLSPGQQMTSAGEPTRSKVAEPDHLHMGSGLSHLKIVAVSRRQKFVRILNQSREQTADLAGVTLRQLEHGFPVRLYRFPPGTHLGPRRQLTIWSESGCGTQKRQPLNSGQEPILFHVSPGCVTLLLGPKGEVLSEHQAPHCVTATARLCAEDTILSVDGFPLPEAQLGADLPEPRLQPPYPRKGRMRQAPGGHGRPPWWLRTPFAFPTPGSPRQACAPTDFPRTSWRRPRPGQDHLALGESRAARTPCPANMPAPVKMPSLSPCDALHSQEVPSQTKCFESPVPELLPFLLEARLGLEDCQARKERQVQVGRRSVDRDCPMVLLSMQNTAESRFGFRFLCCPPITADRSRRYWR